MTITPSALTVTVRDRASMENQLDAAVSSLRAATAYEGRNGILVTRNGLKEFTVELSETVPFGMTYERQEW